MKYCSEDYCDIFSIVQGVQVELKYSTTSLLGQEGVFEVGHDCLAHTKQKFSNIVDLTVLRLAFVMGYGSNKVVQ